MFTWLTRFIERHSGLHRVLLAVWRHFPPRMAGFLKGILARKWVVGAVAVMIDETHSPPEVLLVEHSYRPRGAWGLPGGSLESVPGDPTRPGSEPSRDDVIEYALRLEVMEELGLDIVVSSLQRVDAIPYVVEEPGSYRLDFYFRCSPDIGFSALREGIQSGRIDPKSPEITQLRFVQLTDLGNYDLYSPHERFLKQDLSRLESEFATQPRL